MADSRQNDDAPDGAIGPLAYASPDTDAKVNEIRREIRRQAFARHLKIGPLEAVLMVCILGAILCLLLPLASTGYPASSRARCMSNLRQIGSALCQYASANGGVYPPRLADLCSPTCPGKFFVCPESKTEVVAAPGATPQQCIANMLAGSNHVTYVYVVGGAKMKSLKPWAVVAYEPVPNHGKAPHTYGTVLFADGHVAAFPAATIAAMIQQLKAGQNPPPATGGF